MDLVFYDAINDKIVLWAPDININQWFNKDGTTKRLQVTVDSKLIEGVVWLGFLDKKYGIWYSVRRQLWVLKIIPNGSAF